MSIEFLCSGCQQRLAVPQENAGKQAKCPSCQAVLTVPARSVGRRPDVPPVNPVGSVGEPQTNQSTGGGPNPYAAPSSVSDHGPSVSGELSRQAIDPGYALTIAWELYKRNAAILIGAYVIQMALNFGISFASTLLSILAQNLEGGPSLAAMLIDSISSIVGTVIQWWLTLGYLRITFAIARYQPVDIGMLFSGGRYMLRYVGASILFGLAFGVGLLLLIIPGIYVFLTYWPYMYFIVDRDCSVSESFRLSGEYTPGNRLSIVLIMLISVGLMALGILACLVGWLATMPIAMMMITISYLMMTGQPFSQPR